MSRRSWVLFVLVGIVWGLPYVFIRIAIRDLAPETMIFFRCAITLVALAPFTKRRHRIELLARHWFALIIYSLVEIAIPWYLLARAEQHVTSSLAGLIVATVPIFGLVLAFAYRTEHRVSAVRLVGLAVGLAGVAATIGIDIHGTNTFGIVEILIAAVGYALGPTVFNAYLADASAVTAVAGSFAVATVLYLPFGVTHLPAHLNLEVFGALLGLGLICSVTGFLTFFELVRDVGPARATVVTYINPVVAVVAGVVILGEPLSHGLAIGLPLVILGSILATWATTHERSERAAIVLDSNARQPLRSEGGRENP